MVKKQHAPKKESAKKKRFGDMLVEQGLINKNQLQQALKWQRQMGEGQIGSILLQMGYISIDDLLSVLSKSFGFPSSNLIHKDIDMKVVRCLPLEKILALNVLPVEADKNSVTIAMLNPVDVVIITELEFELGKKIHPVIVPAFMMKAAQEILQTNPRGTLKGKDIAKNVRELRRARKENKAADLQILLKYLMKSDASDMLLTAGVAPSIKLYNDVNRLAMDPLTPEDCEKYAKELMPDRDWEIFSKRSDHDFAVPFPGIGRFRVNVYRQRNSISIAIRPVVDKIPSLKELNIPEWMKDFVLRIQGLILITGASGHGKTTTLSALVNIINTHRRCNIVTLEDPIEYLHEHKMSNVNQREVSRDTNSFAQGLRHVLRQAPDVIVIGEMRDIESFEIALHAAETGHLVISTVHANNTTSIIEKVVNMFPTHQQALIRSMLANTLQLCISQRLVPRKDGKGMILAIEKLINSSKIKQMIRDNKTHQIRSQMQMGSEDYTSLESALSKLYNNNLIKFDDAVVLVENESYFRKLTNRM